MNDIFFFAALFQHLLHNYQILVMRQMDIMAHVRFYRRKEALKSAD